MGQVVSGIVTNEPMNLTFQTITFCKARFQVSKNIENLVGGEKYIYILAIKRH